MKRKDTPKKVIVKKTGKDYDLHSIVGHSNFYEKPKGTIIVKNPLYNPAAVQEFWYFHPNEVEVIEEEKLKISWFERDKKRQEESGTLPQ